MRYELAISLRYFRSRRSDGAMTFISWVAALGVTLGVAALVVAMAVMNGYRANLTRAMSGALPHLRLYPSVLGSLPPVETLKTLFTGSVQPVSISSYVRHQTLIRGPHLGKGEVRGVLIRGIDPAVESKVPDLLAFVRDGSPGWAELPWEDRQERARKVLLGLKTPRGDGIAPVLLSPRLAKLLGVKLGDRLIPLKFPEDGSGFTPLPLPTRLEAAGFTVPRDSCGDPGSAIFWLTDASPAALERARAFLDLGLRRRILVLGSAPDQWARLGAVVVDDPEDFETLRERVLEAASILTEHRDEPAKNPDSLRR
ncbi:MAG: ABC transporter permease [SAR324 cluster bacterium]|nr:ABC transporter permease [SAR324 cluster bacterium]